MDMNINNTDKQTNKQNKTNKTQQTNQNKNKTKQNKTKHTHTHIQSSLKDSRLPPGIKAVAGPTLCAFWTREASTSVEPAAKRRRQVAPQGSSSAVQSTLVVGGWGKKRACVARTCLFCREFTRLPRAAEWRRPQNVYGAIPLNSAG